MLQVKGLEYSMYKYQIDVRLLYFVYHTFNTYMSSCHHVHCAPVVGVEKERRTKNCPWWHLKRQHPLLELPWGLLALCRQTLGSERYRYAMTWPYKLGTVPMAVGGFVYGDAVAESGRNPANKHHIQSESRAAWRGTGRPNPFRETRFSGTNADREMFTFLVQLTTSRIGSHTRLIHTLLYLITIHKKKSEYRVYSI